MRKPARYHRSVDTDPAKRMATGSRTHGFRKRATSRHHRRARGREERAATAAEKSAESARWSALAAVRGLFISLAALFLAALPFME